MVYGMLQQSASNTLTAFLMCNEEARQPKALFDGTKVQDTENALSPGYPIAHAIASGGSHGAAMGAIKLIDKRAEFR